jgi:transcriptional regulator of acetoin/glycerol metabolism
MPESAHLVPDNRTKFQRALEQAAGNVAEAARLLGMNRSRVYRRFPNQV